MNRRLSLVLLATTALTACAVSPATATSVERVIATIQAVLPAVGVASSILAIVYPPAVGFTPIVQTALGAASAALNTMSTTMTQIAAQKPVGDIVAALSDPVSGALPALRQMTAAIAAGNTKTSVLGVLAQIEAALPLLNGFMGLAGAAGPSTVPTILYIRRVG